MGEAINLVNNFKIEKVILNCGEINELEQELIKILIKKQIPYYSCINEIDIEDIKLYFLNDQIYVNLNGISLLLMGDAGKEVEKAIIEKYNLKNIDILKVGHHGSKTSSSKQFIESIDPIYSIISVGRNNRYNHPSTDVLANLSNRIIYRTDIDGTIKFNIKKNKFDIKTYEP